MREVATSGLTGRSSMVNLAITPGVARAAAQSTDTMRACACSLRRNATCSAFTWRSSTKLPRPVSKRGSSVRFTRAPTILGLAWIADSFIGAGALAQPLPLRVVVAADHRRATGLDAPDFRGGFL